MSQSTQCKSDSTRAAWPRWYVTMIATPAARNSATNRSQAIIESEATKRAAPTAATTFPEAKALASIAAITTMYAATGTRSSASVTDRKIRRASGARTATTTTAATTNATAVGPSDQKPAM